MVQEAERFDKTGGYGYLLLNNNQVFEKPYATYGGNYARGQQKYSTGQHRIRFQLEPVLGEREANTILVGIISSDVTATDQYFNLTPSTYAWETSSHEWENETTIVQNGEHQKVSKDKWPGAEIGDVLELTIDCDQRTITEDSELLEDAINNEQFVQVETPKTVNTTTFEEAPVMQFHITQSIVPSIVAFHLQNIKSGYGYSIRSFDVVLA